ncbi:MAG: hypothetical protein PHE79_02835 [Eubacteriales bacterium]|nr:hypothetical protein [Eubacteriales bacterium]
MSRKFFAELSRVLAEQDISSIPLENNSLLVLLHREPACRVQSNGMLYIAPEDLTIPEAKELYHRVAPFSALVYEYTSLLEKAPLLKSDSGNSSYRLLADFNGVVLAGKVMENYTQCSRLKK